MKTKPDDKEILTPLKFSEYRTQQNEIREINEQIDDPFLRDIKKIMVKYKKDLDILKDA